MNEFKAEIFEEVIMIKKKLLERIISSIDQEILAHSTQYEVMCRNQAYSECIDLCKNEIKSLLDELEHYKN